MPPSTPAPPDPDERRPGDPGSARRSARTAVHAAAASLGLHAIALLLFASWVGSPVPTPERPIVQVTLQDRVEDVEGDDPPLESPPEPEPAPIPASEPEPEPEPVPEPEPEPPPEAADPPPPEVAATDAAPDATDVAPPVRLQDLRRQITTLVQRDEEEDDIVGVPPGGAPLGDATPWARAGDPIRGLPLGGGWLNPWVGPVEAYSETWGSVVGEQRGVHVLPNGQVVCTRVDAPTNDELMNPWMSMRVTYMRLCGKERGTAPPSDDLDYAPAPAALRRPTGPGR